jgi:hypothetical protein
MLEKLHSHNGRIVLNVETLENEKGLVQIEFCATCGEPVSIICEHVKNSWTKGPVEVLLCDLCGMDGT